MSAGGEHLKDEGTRKQTVLAGGTAGLISRFCIAPLDVVKIRLQLQIHSLSDPMSHQSVNGPIYKGTLSTMRAIVRQEGITVRFILHSHTLLILLFHSSELTKYPENGKMVNIEILISVYLYRAYGKEMSPQK